MKIHRRFKPEREVVLHLGDCVELLKQLPSNSVRLTITSPPYCMNKEYEGTKRLQHFVTAHLKILPEVIRVTKPGGSICWQVGNHVKRGQVIPLDFLVNDLMRQWPEMILRNRIVWTFGHGLHGQHRFSGRHETILWYTKGHEYDFHLDRVRVPQKYPGKRFYKGLRKGEFSCNPFGKNPGDVWEIPNVKANHVEKTSHPCQFPVALIQRLIRALTNPGDTVLDPFMGSGTTPAAAILESRRTIGAETQKRYYRIAYSRCKEADRGRLRYRHLDKPIHVPSMRSEVTRNPFVSNEKEQQNGEIKKGSPKPNLIPLFVSQTGSNDARALFGAGG